MTEQSRPKKSNISWLRVLLVAFFAVVFVVLLAVAFVVEMFFPPSPF